MRPGLPGSPTFETDFDVDVIVLGAGPAGAAFALNLAPHHRVVLLDRQPTRRPRIGETLAPASRRLLEDMELWTGFLNLNPSPCHAHRSAWGSNDVTEADSLRNLDGPGWQIDRAGFETWLRETARARGAVILEGASLGDLRPIPAPRASAKAASWQLTAHHLRSTFPLRARLIVDATGRSSTLPTSLGARRTPQDRLVSAWLHGRDLSETDRDAGVLWVVAEPDGWWYTAPLPGGNRVLAFHTDADLPVLRTVTTNRDFLARALEQPHLGPLLQRARFSLDGTSTDRSHPGGSPRLVRAQTSRLLPASGPAWLAVGDAAQSFDPLVSQGLFHALYTGLAGAEAADRFLSGNPQALEEYARSLGPIQNTCRRELAAWYAREQRWADREFWRRRHDSPTSGSNLTTAGQPIPREISPGRTS